MTSRSWGSRADSEPQASRRWAMSRPQRRRRARTVAIRALERLEDRTLLAVATWDGEGVLRDSQGNIIRQADHTSWEDNLNWVDNVLPAPGDDVVIPDVAATSVVTLGN